METDTSAFARGRGRGGGRADGRNASSPGKRALRRQTILEAGQVHCAYGEYSSHGEPDGPIGTGTVLYGDQRDRGAGLDIDIPVGEIYVAVHGVLERIFAYYSEISHMAVVMQGVVEGPASCKRKNVPGEHYGLDTRRDDMKAGSSGISRSAAESLPTSSTVPASIPEGRPRQPPLH